jgi:tetratricopeptide (TPR) repeat protein
MVRYERDPDGEYWVLRPNWRVLLPILFFLVASVYLSAVFIRYWLDRYYYGCEATELSDMFVCVIPNRIPVINYVFLPNYLNNIVMDARARQTKKMSAMLRNDPRTINDLLVAAHLAPENLDLQFQAAYYFISPDWLSLPETGFTVLDATLPRIIAKGDALNDLTRYVQFCFQYDQDIRIIHAAEAYLDDPRLNNETRSAFAISYAEALFLRGELEKACAVLEKYKLTDTLAGFLLRTRIFWENGEQERAILLLKHFITNSIDGRERLLYALATCQREIGRTAEAVQSIEQITALNPTEPRPRLFLLSLLDEINDTARRNALIEDYVTRFGSDESAMLALSSYAADKGNVPLQERLNKHALDNNFSNLANFRLLIIETLINAGSHAKALTQIAELFQSKPTWLQRNESIRTQFEAIRMFAYFSSGQADLGAISFKEFIKNRIKLPMMIATARSLLKLNRTNEAKELLLQAYKRNHQNQSILLELIKIDLKSKNTETLGEYLTSFLKSRRPPRHVLREAYEHLGSDRYLFTPNRDELLEKMDSLLRSRSYPITEIEKSWPVPSSAPPPITPIPIQPL